MRRYFLYIAILLTTSIHGQIDKSGTPLTWGVQPEAITPSIWRTLPTFDVLNLLSEDDIDQTIKVKPYRFAFSTDVDYNLINSGRWTTLPNGDRIWALGLSSEQAFSLNVIFSRLNMPQGAKLYIYNEDQSDFLGPLTNKNNRLTGEFTTLPIAGGRVIIEYFEPFAVRGQGEIEVGKVAQGYKTLTVPQFAEFECFEELPVSPNGALGALKASSLLMLVDGGQRVATGNLLNNTIGDGQALIMTASSALLGDPSSWVFVVNNTFACGSSQEGLGFMCWDKALSGAQILAQSASTGLSLLSLSESPRTQWGVYFAGWNKEEPQVDHFLTIQHAFGKRQSIAEYAGDLQELNWEGLQVAKLENWDRGNTFVGSLGAPLFNSQGQFCGAFVGGNAKCNGEGEDYFGLLHTAWADFASSLNPAGTDKNEAQGFYPIFVEENEEAAESLEVFLFPNPASDFIYIQNQTDNAVLKVKIIDAIGREVSVYQPELPYLDVTSLPNGNYQLLVYLSDKPLVKRLVIRH